VTSSGSTASPPARPARRPASRAPARVPRRRHNGKGSTCAFLRAAIEAAGLTAHVYTSPHLVRFNERIRLAGKLIEDEPLAALLDEVLGHADGLGATFFEITTAAAFLAFSRMPADACIVEVGLGGRLDATNVIERPAVCGIAQLGLDHQAFLGDSVEAIAAEKAGIAKPSVPLVTMSYPELVAARIAEVARERGAWVHAQGDGWFGGGWRGQTWFGDDRYPLPALSGEHQANNFALAIAMLSVSDRQWADDFAITRAAATRWPARLQRLGAGPLGTMLPDGAELWLDGGHNAAAARAVSDHFRAYIRGGRPFHIIFGLLETKDAAGVIEPFRERSPTFHTVPIPGHAHHSPAALAALAREMGIAAFSSNSVPDALGWIARHADRAAPPVVLILGSLYLAGEVLKANGEEPS
jgi:dihydrofolate synthase/folylpolyglutamate synthase